MPLVVGLIPFGLIVGAIGVQVGMEPEELMFMSLAVFAGAAQFIALDMWTTATGASIIATTLLINLRHILMGASAYPIIAPMPAWTKLPFLYVMADENWATVMRRSRTNPPVTPAYVIGVSLPMYLFWQVSCFTGTQVGNVIGDPARWGFDFVFTAVFLTLVLGFWRTDGRFAPIGASAVAALIAARVLPGSWFILVGSLSGLLAALLTFRPQTGRPETGQRETGG